MDQFSQIVSAAAGLIGISIGYLMGFKNGRLAGELAALKSSHRHDRHRRPRTGLREGEKEVSNETDETA